MQVVNLVAWWETHGCLDSAKGCVCIYTGAFETIENFGNLLGPPKIVRGTIKRVSVELPGKQRYKVSKLSKPHRYCRWGSVVTASGDNDGCPFTLPSSCHLIWIPSYSDLSLLYLPFLII
jgi:hypothetical protein